MSFLHEKVACKCCGDLYDVDLLNEEGECRDCGSFDPRDHDDDYYEDFDDYLSESWREEDHDWYP